MAELYFKIGADFENVIRLRDEIKKLENQLKGFGKSTPETQIKQTEERLASTRQEFTRLTTEAARAGAAMENDFKKKIYDASQTVNGLSEKIIAQRAVIKDVEFDVKRLGEAYRTALKYNPFGASSELGEYKAAKKALDEEKAALFGLTQQQAEARLSVKKLRDEYSLYKKEAGGTVDVNNGLSISWGKMLGVIGGVTALKQLGSEIVRVRGEFQSMQTAIETMVGKDMAGSLIPQIKELAKVSPLTLTDMVNAEKMMLGFNIQAEDTIRYLQALSDISMGDGVKFKSLTLAFSQMSAAGKLMGQDLNQMINAGFNPLQIIAEKTGKSIATLKDEMSKGAVSAEMVQQAFIDATSAGGKFYQMSENASKTINGQLSMMQDALDNAFNEMGQASEGVIMGAIQATTSLIQNYETVGKVLAGLVTTYGAYRTAVMLATVATSKHTIEEVALTNAKVLARKAQLLLNAAMLTNPYVLAATAVTSLGIALINSANNADKCQKGIDAYNKSVEEAAKRTAEHKAEIENLLSVAQDEQSSTDERREALIKLEEQYPSIFKQYKTEAEMLQDILNIKRKINEEDNRRDRKEDEEELKRLNSEIDKLNNAIKSASRSGAGQAVPSLVNERNNLIKQRDLKQEDVNKKNKDDILSNLSGYSNKQLEKEILTRERLLKRLENAQKLGKGIQSGRIRGGMFPGTKTSEQIQTEKQVMERELNSRSKTSYKDAYEEARKKWEEAKKELSNIEADKDKFTAKQYEDAKKRVETAEKAYNKLGGDVSSKKNNRSLSTEISNQEEINEELLALRRKNQEDMISLMEDGHRKKMAEIQKEYEDEISEIEEQERKWEEQQGGTLTLEQRVEISKARETAYATRDKSISEINDEYEKKEEERLQNLLGKYQDYVTKYKSTMEKFAKDRKDLEAAGASDAQLKELDYQRDETVNAINEEFASREETFNAWADNVVNMSLEQLRELLREAYEEMMNLEISDPNNANLATVRAKVGMIRDLISKKNLEDEVSPGNAKKDWDKLYKVLEDVNEVFGEIGDTVGGTLGEIISLAGESASGALQLAGAIKGVGAAVSGLEKASAILAAISAAMKVVSGIAGVFKNAFGADYSEYEALKAQYDELIQVWDELIDKKMEYIDIDYGIEARKAADEAASLVNTNINRNRQLAMQLMGSGASAGSHSLGYRVDVRMNGGDWERLSEIVGKRVENLEDVLNLDADVIGKTLTDERFVSVLTEVNDEFIDYIGNISDYSDQLEEIAEKEREALTGIGIDEFRDSYVDMLSDLDSTNEDFADNFSKYLQQAIFTSLVANKYKDRIEALYQQWATDSESGGSLTTAEAERLREVNDEIVEDMLAEREQIMNAFGWSSSEEETPSHQASSAVSVQASQESVDMANGRLTALQEIGYNVLNTSQQQAESITQLSGSVSGILDKTSGMYNIADETRTIIANSYLELKQISENTGAIVKPIQQIQKDIEQVKNNTSRI